MEFIKLCISEKKHAPSVCVGGRCAGDWVYEGVVLTVVVLGIGRVVDVVAAVVDFTTKIEEFACDQVMKNSIYYLSIIYVVCLY